MNHLHSANRKERTEGLMLKNIKMREILQYVCFLLILLFWLLYQNYRSYQIREDYHFEHIDNKLRNERIGKLLGRKGGLRVSIGGGGEVDLYGMDLVGETEGIKHVAKDNNAEGEEDVGSNADGNYADEFLRNHTDEEESVNGDSNDDLNRKSFGEYLAKERKTEEKLQEDKANASTVILKSGDEGEKDDVILEKRGDEGEKDGRRNGSEAVSVVSFGAVILKSNDDKWKVFRFNDENGVPKHESGPSRRSDIEVVSLFEQNKSRPESDSKEMDECQKLCLQKFLDKQRLSKAEQEAVHEEIKDLTAVDSEKETMRELLQKVS